MDKTFDVCGIPTAMLIYRGISLRPRTEFNVKMTENELNGFKPFMEIISCTPIHQESETIIEVKEEPKGVNNEDKQQTSNRNKRKTTK